MMLVSGTCAKCKTGFQDKTYSELWIFGNHVYCSRECRSKAIDEWKAAHTVTEDANDEPDAAAVAHLEAAYEERTEYEGA